MFDLDREFFVIESDKLDSVRNGFYGFCISGSDVILGEDAPTADELTPEGAYIHVEVDGDAGIIRIRQDFMGCYGLYLFEDAGRDRWALSNSFLYLVDAVKAGHELTFNVQYADHTLAVGLSALSYEETLVEEIRCLDRAAIVTVDIASRTLSTELVDFGEETVDVDSAEGMAILDGWYSRWTAMIANLGRKTSNISVDLTGGFDSRQVFGLFLGSGIDLGKVFVHSNDDGLHTHVEDFGIASSIAGHYGFALNVSDNISQDAVAFTDEDALDISMYTKLGFHTQMYYKVRNLREYRYSFMGDGGGCIRDLSTSLPSWTNEQALAKSYRHEAEPFGARVVESTRAVIGRSVDGIREKYRGFGREISPDDIGMRMYMETRDRNHFGKALVEMYLAGTIALCPLIDSQLRKLRTDSAGCSDKNLLVATIMGRYNPDLLGFEFEGGRAIDPGTVEHALEISGRYPVALAEPAGGPARVPVRRLGDGDASAAADDGSFFSVADMRSLTRTAFESPTVRGEFETVYPEKVYCELSHRLDARPALADAEACVVLGIVRVLGDCRASGTCASGSRADGTVSKWVLRQAGIASESPCHGRSLRRLPSVCGYVTARLDIKNAGDGCSVDIADLSDEFAQVTSPAWLNKGGGGRKVQSEQGSLKLNLVCKGDGVLQFALRGIDQKDSNGGRIPFWIDCSEFTVDGEDVLADADSGRDGTYVRCACHDRPVKFEKAVQDGDVVEVSVKWGPHDETAHSLTMRERASADPAMKALSQEADALKKRNAELESQLEDIQAQAAHGHSRRFRRGD